MDSLDRILDGTARCLARCESRTVDRPLLAAVSGGLDSTVLAFVLARLQEAGRLPGPVHLAHIDHGMQLDSGANAQFVVDLADRFDLPVHVRQLRLDPDASEDTMRQARYGALEHIAAGLSAGAILTGHHADDNLETVLFRMMRGSSYRGLAGIPTVRETTGGRLLVRPLLSYRRSTLERIQDRYGLSVWQDLTNHDLRYSRNLLRHRTIPSLRATLGVGLDAALMVVSRTARAASDIVEAQGRRVLSEWGQWVTPWRLELSLPTRDGEGDDPVAPDDPFVRDALRQAHEALHHHRGTPLQEWLNRAMALCLSDTGARLDGRRGQAPSVTVERTRRGLLLIDPARIPVPPTAPVPLELDAGRTRFGKTEWTLNAFRQAEPPLNPPPSAHGPLRALVDPSFAPLPWSLRTRRPGDRFRPLGARAPVDLRRFLASRGVPRFDRDRLPVLVDGRGNILWVPGVEIAHEARIRLNTHRCVEIRVERG